METEFPSANNQDYDRVDSPNFDIPIISIEPAVGIPRSNEEGYQNFVQTLQFPPDVYSGQHRSIGEDFSSGSEYTPSPSTSFRSLSPLPADGRALQQEFDQFNDYGEPVHYTHLSDLLEYPLGELRHSRSSDSVYSLGSTNTNPSLGNYITPASSVGSSVEKLGTYVDSLGIDSTDPQGATTYDPSHGTGSLNPGFTLPNSGNSSAGVTIRDMLALLSEAGSSMASKDPDDIRKAFIDRLMLSDNKLPVNDFTKPAKMEIGTAATLKASKSRRKCEATFVCELCPASFTRKNGVMNHYRSHLGIADKHCMFCKRGFTTSLGRHIKKCKSNPDRSRPPLKKENR